MAKPGNKYHHAARDAGPAKPDPPRLSRAVPWLLAGLILIAAAWGLGRKLVPGPGPANSTTRQPSGPNVLLISIDTLRPDHLGCYGYQRATSPRLDQLAAEGVLFENAISSTSWTLPAHAALFTSLADSVHGCTDTDRRLSDNVVTLAEQFAAAGYETAGFFSGPYLHPAFGLGQGFERYENCTSYARIIDDNPADQWAMDAGVMRRSHQDITNPIVYPAVKRWLDENQSAKFFLFVHLWDVHFDFIPPPPYDTMFDPDYAGTITGENFFFDQRVNANMPERDLDHLVALYDGEIAWTDHHVGKILNDLQQAGLLDETVVAVTSDHGTEFFEHGGKAHRMTLFDEVIRIPLILRYPASLPAGLRVQTQTRIIDVAPTLLELAGVTPQASLMGHSLLALTREGPLDFDNTAVSELFSVGRRIRTIRSLDWKFTELIADNRRYYVNLIQDPGEQHPLHDLSLGLGRRLENRYERTVEALKACGARIAAGADQSSIPPEVMSQLESLGYVGKEGP